MTTPELLISRLMPENISLSWGATITAYRQFGSGWEVGGYQH